MVAVPQWVVVRSEQGVKLGRGGEVRYLQLGEPTTFMWVTSKTVATHMSQPEAAGLMVGLEAFQLVRSGRSNYPQEYLYTVEKV